MKIYIFLANEMASSKNENPTFPLSSVSHSACSNYLVWSACNKVSEDELDYEVLDSYYLLINKQEILLILSICLHIITSHWVADFKLPGYYNFQIIVTQNPQWIYN